MPRPRLEPSEVAHGTLAGYDWHRRWKSEVCPECREAKRLHSLNHARNKRKQELEEAPRRAAWQRACAKLAERYPAEFRQLLVHEMRGLVRLPAEDEGTDNEM